ncbi:replication protein A 70 kDa DNA-binding subunit C-like protein [Tanacetum coccineum]
MSTKAAGSKADIESKQAMSTKAPNSKHDMSTAGMETDIESKQDMHAKTVGMVCCSNWRYLSDSHICPVSDAKNDTFMLEFDGSTTIRKAFVKVEGFVRYPFQLVDFDSIEPTNNKYLIDVVGYVTNVGRTTYQKSGFMNLDFYLANHRGQSIRVTLRRGLEDVLIEQKTKHVGMCPIILTSTTAKYYNDKLYLSISSSTMIFDDAEIPTLKTLRLYENIGVESKNPSLNVNLSQPMEGTLENLLILQPSTIRYRLELDVSDDTAHVVVIMFDEPTTSLVKCSVESIVEAEDEQTSLVQLTFWKSSPAPTTSMETLKVSRVGRLIRLKELRTAVDIEDSDTEASGDSAKGASKDRAARVFDMKKRSVVIEDSDTEVSCGSTKGTRTRVAFSLIRKK